VRVKYVSRRDYWSLGGMVSIVAGRLRLVGGRIKAG
jgi:hypothetical protein